MSRNRGSSGRPGTRDKTGGRDRVIRYRTGFHNTIGDALSSRGWKEVESNETDWDINWCDTGWMRENFDHIHLEEHQRVNHFRNHYELTRKDLLIKNLKRMKKQLEREDRHEEAMKYDFFPTSFVLPQEYGMFVEEFKKCPGQAWIMKPIGKAQGRGIFLFTKLNQISDWKKDHRWKADAQQAETYVVQRYIENPYLVGGKKFDLRLYVLVMSYSPLDCWVYRSGFARFSSSRFTMNLKDIDSRLTHLTNVAVQRGDANYDPTKGCKWSLRNLKLYMISKHGKDVVEELFLEMQNIIIRSLLSVQKVIINDKHCFEVYGYDIMIDDDLKPWLIEVNASPSLTADTKADYELKLGMLSDSISIVDMDHKLTGNEEQVGGFDLIYRGGPVHKDKKHITPFLGCFNNRDKVNRRIRKQYAKRMDR
eukprot:Rmarinus@m.3497